MLKAVAFDLWETLITNTPELTRAHQQVRMAGLEAVLLSRGHVAEAEQIERAYHGVWTRCQELYWSEDRDIPCRRQIEVFLEELGVDANSLDAATLDELERIYANAAVEALPEIVAGARTALADIVRRGLRVGLISNTGRTPGYALREVLSRLDLAPHFDAMIFSDEHGACKPQQSIFEQLRESLGVEYREMLFIGDNLYVDVLGAKRVGMRAVHFVPPTRGTAVAPAVDHGPVEPDAVVTRLADLIPIIEGMRDEG